MDLPPIDYAEESYKHIRRCAGHWCKLRMPLDHKIVTDRNAAWKALGKFGALGIMLAACIIAGLTAGYILDQHLDTAPWLTMALLTLGIIAGFINIFQKTMSRGGKQP